MDRTTLDLIAACLEYPGPETALLARRAAERTAGDHIAMARALWDLAVRHETSPVGEVEERYTALFDLNPVCTLHIGYQVFGDTYPRGAFIANLAGELRKAGVSRGEDLPDFLPTVLRLLGRLEPEDAEILLGSVVQPGLEKMAKALEDSTSPWSDLLRALPGFLADRAEETSDRDPAASNAEGAAHA